MMCGLRFLVRAEEEDLGKKSCPWHGNNPLYRRYHDEEWGVPCRDDAKLFEFLVLEGAQAGLSWITILRKRENYRRAFADFNVEVVSRFTESDLVRLMNEDGIVRNRAKISSAQNNACCFIKVQSEFGSFSNYLWNFFDDEPLVNCWQDFEQVPSKTKLSLLISQDMMARGFNFFGPTICYSYLQAMGFINDHVEHCFRWSECQTSN